MGDLVGDDVAFFFCSNKTPLNVASFMLIFCLRVDLLGPLVGVFSLESVPESVSKFKSLRELLQLSVSAMRLARLLRALLEVEEVVWALAQECVDDGVPRCRCTCGVAGVDSDECRDSWEYLVWYFFNVKGDLMKFFKSWLSFSSLLEWLLVSSDEVMLVYLS